LSNKALWLDAADAGTITLNGSTVSQWNDKSGNGRNVAQSNAAKQPTYSTGYLNGNNAISFDGTGRSLSAGTATINLSQPFNRFIVGKFLTKSSQSVIVDGNNGSGAGGQQVFYNGESAGSWRMACDAPAYAKSISYGTSDFNNHIHFHNLNGASTYYSIDGATTLSGPGDPGSTGQPGICIGNIRNEFVTGYGFQGYVYEIILTTGTLSPADRQKIEGYLAWKWGTQASLPVGHPYESAAPESSDTTPPTIATLNPTDEATGVLTYANLSATFSESIQKGTGNITLKKSADNSTVETFDVATSPRITVSGATLTIDPTSNLEGNTGYYVEIDATAVKDTANNSFAGIADAATWNFTTGVADTTAPTIATLSPADDATGADLVANLVATFDENIQKGTGFITLKKTADNSEVETFDVATSPRITVSGATLTIDPTANLAVITGYYVQIAPAAIQDLSGNSFAGIADSTTWNFTTTSSITVLDPSFQSNVLADGAYITSASNWTVAEFGALTGRVTWNPSGFFTGDGGNGTPLGADQSQVFTIFGGDSSSGARLYQDTTSPLAAGMTYTLTVAVGRRLSGDAASWGIDLMTTSQTPGSQYLARLTGTYADLTTGQFVDKVVTFTAPADHPNLGQNLRVHFWSQGIDASHTSTAFDNVRLSVALTPPNGTLISFF
jgi:methionine-rich copper-binding protein CopC